MPEAGGIHPTLLQNKDSSSPRERGRTTDGQAHTLRLGTAVVRIRSSLACSVLGELRGKPWYFVVGGIAIALGDLGAIAGDGSRPSWIRWLAVAGMVIGIAIAMWFVWRLYLRSRIRHVLLGWG
jgi:hypothetical protein